MNPRPLLLLAALVVACGPPETTEPEPTQPNEVNETIMTLAPWHMWGGAAQVEASTLTTGLHYTTTGQLARIEYKRPESWRFLFYVQIVSFHTTAPAIFQVDFNVQTGVGRSNLNISPFETFKFLLPIGNGGNLVKYSGDVNGPVRDDTAATPADPPTPNVIDTIVGQDVQVGFTAGVQLTNVGDTVNATVAVALAPWHHARPDWVLREFSGEEIKGK